MPAGLGANRVPIAPKEDASGAGVHTGVDRGEEDYGVRKSTSRPRARA